VDNFQNYVVMLIVYHLHKPVDLKIDRAATSDAWL
jgi:hypothetical protein